MMGTAWDRLESLAVKSISKIGQSKPINLEEADDPQQTPRNQSVVSGHQGRSTVGEGQRTPKRKRKNRSKETEESPEEGQVPYIEIEDLGEADYERFKQDPMEVCAAMCRAAGDLMKRLKMEGRYAAADAITERDAALKKLEDLKPQIAAMEATKARLEKAVGAKVAAEEDKAKAKQEKANATKKNQNLVAQVKDLKGHVAELEKDKAALEDQLREVVGLAKEAATYQFQNAVDQMRVLNANRNIDVDDRVLRPEHCVEGDEIVLPLKKDAEGVIVQQRTVVFGRT